MNSKAVGADLVFAWEDAKIGMMDAEMAVKIMYADEIAMIAYSTGLSSDNRCKITKKFRHSQIFHAKNHKNLNF